MEQPESLKNNTVFQEWNRNNYRSTVTLMIYGLAIVFVATGAIGLVERVFDVNLCFGCE